MRRTTPRTPPLRWFIRAAITRFRDRIITVPRLHRRRARTIARLRPRRRIIIPAIRLLRHRRIIIVKFP